MGAVIFKTPALLHAMRWGGPQQGFAYPPAGDCAKPATLPIGGLSPIQGVDSSPFGPALYLTEDPDVAGCYVKGRGAIYVVEVTGNDALTIPMNATWKELSVDARLAITKMYKAIDTSVPNDINDARTTLDGVLPEMNKRQRNEFLAAEGIWMLYGYIDAMEHSGLCDRGVQYALLSRSAIASQNFFKP